MKTLLRGIRAFLPHLLLAFSQMLVLFCILHRFNPFMQFLDSRLSQVFECIYAVTALAAAYSALRAGRNTISAVLSAVLTAAFLLPVMRAVAGGDGLILTKPYFCTAAAFSGICTFCFSVCEIYAARHPTQKT